MTQDFEALRRFVDSANNSGRINYDYGCKIIEEKEDHVVVKFFDTDVGESEDDIQGKLWMYNEGFMAWQEDDTLVPIIFTDFPWILVSITYAGP